MQRLNPTRELLLKNAYEAYYNSPEKIVRYNLTYSDPYLSEVVLDLRSDLKFLHCEDYIHADFETSPDICLYSITDKGLEYFEPERHAVLHVDSANTVVVGDRNMIFSVPIDTLLADMRHAGIGDATQNQILDLLADIKDNTSKTSGAAIKQFILDVTAGSLSGQLPAILRFLLNTLSKLL